MTISEELKKKLDLLDKYDKAYYNEEPLVNDTQYDLLKDYVLRHLPPDHPRLSKIGHDPCSTWPKEEHKIFMGSQNKVSNEEEIRKWIEKVYRIFNRRDIPFILQFKIDGFSLELQYSKGILFKAITRGNGNIGEDITPNARLFRCLPQILPIKEDVIIRAESYLYLEDFGMIQKGTADHYKNPRNAASGISRRQDGKYNKYIRVRAYDTNAKVTTESQKIEVISKLGFKTVPTYRCKDIEEILKVYKGVKEKRSDIPYEIDGLVLKIDDLEIQRVLGIKNGRPEGQVALKFSSDQALTTLRGIKLQVGRTGRVTPVGSLEPVDLMGSTIRKATLHNFDYIEQNFISIGADVVIEKKGDIIPQVVDIASPGEKYKRPQSCPSCGGELDFDGVNLWCNNHPCMEKEINRVSYWVKTLDMKGFSKKFIKKLWDLEKIRSVEDIYKLTPDDLSNIEGIGKKTINSFFKVLSSTSEMFLEVFITALGIPMCSKATAKVLVENFSTWDKISTLQPEDLEKLPGFAKVSSENVCSGIREVDEIAQKLLSVIKIKKVSEGKLLDKSFCVTGSLKAMPRNQFHQLIMDHGGIVKTSVVKGLSYLVTNDSESGSSKNRKARKLEVPIINEDQFFELIGERPQIEEEKEDSNEIKLVTENLFE